MRDDLAQRDPQARAPQDEAIADRYFRNDGHQMRTHNDMKRQRGRGRKPSNNQGNRNFESNGPDVKIRGNAAHIYEKYLQLARDASSSGDRVMAENYYQHAEHYFRILQLSQPRREERDSDDDGDDGDDIDDRNSHQTQRHAGGDTDEGERSERQNGERQGAERHGGDRQGGDRQGGDRQPRSRRDRRPPRRPEGEHRQHGQDGASRDSSGGDHAQPDPLRMVDPGTAGGDSQPSSGSSEQPEPQAEKPRAPRTRRPRRSSADAEAEAALKSASGDDADAA